MKFKDMSPSSRARLTQNIVNTIRIMLHEMQIEDNNVILLLVDAEAEKSMFGASLTPEQTVKLLSETLQVIKDGHATYLIPPPESHTGESHAN